MPQPLFGTALDQAAAIYAGRGPEQGKAFYMALKGRGIQVLDGNSVVRDSVMDGRLAWGVVDSDDACYALEKGAPVAIMLLDQAQKSGSDAAPAGVLVIPNTLAMVAGRPPAGASFKVPELRRLAQPGARFCGSCGFKF
jgi:iron(III) transport system substrate-binding protein